MFEDKIQWHLRNCLTLQDLRIEREEFLLNNYMDYSPCSFMFTAGQVSRMQATLLDTTLSRRIIL